MCFVNILLRCVPIALQLAGACVVINAMSLVGSIDDNLNHAILPLWRLLLPFALQTKVSRL